MNRPSLFYSEPIYRPPSEGKNSLLLTATIGCSFRCTYCYPYMNKKFSIRSLSEIFLDIENARTIYGNNVERIFLLDGNAFVMKPDQLIQIAEKCYQIHPNLQRISAYAHAKDILRKSDQELEAIKHAGINMVYLGIETGDDALLQKINKKTNSNELAEAAQKLHRANIILSGTIILGLGGKDAKLSEHHALATADLINRMNPEKEQEWYISALTLMIPPGTPLDNNFKSGEFIPMENTQILEELKLFLENISNKVHGCIFRANHASNYLPLKGILARDKINLIQTVQQAIHNPSSLRPEFYRGL